MREITVLFLAVYILLFIVGGWVRNGIVEKLEQIRIEISKIKEE